MFNQYFNGFRTKLTMADGREEKIALTRQGRSGTSNFKSNFVWTGLCSENTQLKNGDVFSCRPLPRMKEEKFLVISVRPSALSTQATVYQCNGVAEIQRKGEDDYDEYGNVVSAELKTVGEVSTNHVTVNATMRLLDAGLLPSTTKEFRLPKCDIKLMDRIALKVNGEVEGYYCVDAIDTTKFDGLLAVQTSNDNRSL